jgi:quercetin dioxygenase-like cupin family protein
MTSRPATTPTALSRLVPRAWSSVPLIDPTTGSGSRGDRERGEICRQEARHVLETAYAPAGAPGPGSSSDVCAVRIIAWDRAEAQPVSGHFAGEVRTQDLNLDAPEDGVELVAVFFEAGARTLPHVHPVEQTLVVVEGEGIVADESGRRRMRAGDVVVVPAGVWHWHGATPESAVCHLSAKKPSDTVWDGVPLLDWETYP